METVEDILNFWFGSNPDDGIVALERAPLWWGKSPVTDAQMRQRFGDVMQAASDSTLGNWQRSPRGRLALILLTDQVPRNIFRDTAQAFSYDQCALEWASSGIAKALDLKLRPIERVFFYLPFEHAESIERQNQSVELFTTLARTVPPAWQNRFASYLDFAERHRAVIERFGRFPHRNKPLGRRSTEAEIAYLAEPGSSF